MRITRGLLYVVLTAVLGRVTFNGHQETYYNLNMSNIVNRAHKNGIEGAYWIDGDGVKRFDEYVIVAADWSIHPYGSLVDTSRGTGIVLDTGDFIKEHPADIDIAVTW